MSAAQRFKFKKMGVVKVKIKFFITVILLLSSVSAFADTRIGLGTNVNTLISYSDSNAYVSSGNIFLPIRINNKVLLEPYLIYSKYKEEGDSSYLLNSDSKGLGFGVFYIVNLRESIYTYFGGKLSWYESNWNVKFQDGDEDKYESENIGIVPLVGLEYKIHDFVFVALETGIGYNDSKVKRSDRFQETRDVDSSNVNTFTNIMFRMMF
jgi:hypothetical protein